MLTGLGHRLRCFLTFEAIKSALLPSGINSWCGFRGSFTLTFNSSNFVVLSDDCVHANSIAAVLIADPELPLAAALCEFKRE